MKKIISLVLFALFLSSCTTDPTVYIDGRRPTMKVVQIDRLTDSTSIYHFYTNTVYEWKIELPNAFARVGDEIDFVNLTTKGKAMPAPVKDTVISTNKIPK